MMKISVKETMAAVAALSTEDIHAIARDIIQDDPAHADLAGDPLLSELLGDALADDLDVLAERLDDGDGLRRRTPDEATEQLREHLAEVDASAAVNADGIWSPAAKLLPELLGRSIWRGQTRVGLMTTGMAHPAIPNVILADLARIAAVPLDVVHAGGRVELRTRRRGGTPARRVGHLVTSETAPDLPAEPEALVGALRTTHTHRLLRGLLHLGWSQEVRGAADGTLSINGGFRELSRQLGKRGGKAAARLRSTLCVLQHVVLPGAADAGVLVEVRESRGRRAMLRIELAGPLRIGYVNERKSRRQRNRRLVPLPPDLPPFGDLQTNRYPAVCSFEMLLLGEVREQAECWATHGTVHLRPEDLHALGEIVGLRPTDVDHLMDLWSEGSDRLLERVGDDDYDLGPSRGLMRMFLREAASSTRQGRASRLRSNSVARR